MLKTPVLFIIFNRPETTLPVFEAIRKAQPRQLFVAADGPRPNKEGEKERCEEARRIATKVDWDCEVKTLFREENIGCGRGPAEAITWFFGHVEQGIILEDDCLPSESFFSFCEDLLERYKHKPEVMLISGTNILGKIKLKHSYFFSKHAGIWGWATWRRAWMHYDYSMKDWGEALKQQKVEDFFKNDLGKQQYYKNRFQETFEGKNISWWDYQWYYLRIIQNGIGIIPSVNLISNIGFGETATHTFDSNSKEARLHLFKLEWPLNHPKSMNGFPPYDKKINQSPKKFLTKVKYYLLKPLRSIIKS
jgi:hypothetical protein